MALRVISDDGVVGAFSAELRAPDRLQQAWHCRETGEYEWRDVQVIGASKLK